MKAVLVTFKSTGERCDIAIQRPQTVIGRAEDCALRIPVSEVSRNHCQLSMNNGSLRLKDLGSSNGTYVNHKRVLETDLKAGDLVRVGPVTFTVQLDGKPTEVKPIKPGPPKPAPSKGKNAKSQAAPGKSPATAKPAAPPAEKKKTPAAEPSSDITVSPEALQPLDDSDLDKLGLDDEGDPFASLGELTDDQEFDSDIMIDESSPAT